MVPPMVVITPGDLTCGEAIRLLVNNGKWELRIDA